jgi:hypothetical protein
VKCLVTFQALSPPQPSLGTEDSLLSEWDIDCRTRSFRIIDQLLSKGSLTSDEDIRELDWTPDAFKHHVQLKRVFGSEARGVKVSNLKCISESIQYVISFHREPMTGPTFGAEEGLECGWSMNCISSYG